MVNEVLAENDTAARDAYRRALTNPRTALDALRLAALLNREIGTGPKIELNPGESGPLNVTLHWPDEAEPGDARSEPR